MPYTPERSPVFKALCIAFCLVCTLLRYDSGFLLGSTDFCKRMRRLAIALVRTCDWRGSLLFAILLCRSSPRITIPNADFLENGSTRTLSNNLNRQLGISKICNNEKKNTNLYWKDIIVFIKYCTPSGGFEWKCNSILHYKGRNRAIAWVWSLLPEWNKGCNHTKCFRCVLFRVMYTIFHSNSFENLIGCNCNSDFQPWGWKS